MTMPPLVAVDVPLLGDDRRKHWAKVVERVDAAKSTGWAFEGSFIAAGGIQDVPVGSVVLVYGERGSRANPIGEAAVFVANADGTLSPRGSAKGRAWARTLRDTVEELLEVRDAVPRAPKAWDPGLMAYDTDALRHELERRAAAE